MKEKASFDKSNLVEKEGEGKSSIMKLFVQAVLIFLIAKYSMLFCVSLNCCSLASFSGYFCVGEALRFTG